MLSRRVRFATVVLATVAVGACLVQARAVPVDAGPAPPADGGGRVVAVADIHGDLEAFAGILQRAGLIDADRHWIGGRATLVQTGDFLDRGAHVRGVMDLMMSLEAQAERAGGRVVVLLGNHEAMNLLHDFHDVSRAAFASFADGKAGERREAAYAEYRDWMAGLAKNQALAASGFPPPAPMPRNTWLEKHPPGYFEYTEAFGPRGRYGAWLREKDAAARVNGTLFVHGGVHPDFAPERFEDLNKEVRNEIARFDEIRQVLADEGLAKSWFTLGELVDAVNRELMIVKAGGRRESAPSAGGGRASRAVTDVTRIFHWNLLDSNRPLWFRGFARWTEKEGTPIVTRLLKRYGAEHFAVGHTVVDRVAARFGGRVFVMDTGMLSSVYKNGRASALEIEDGRFTAIYGDRREILWPPDASAAVREHAVRTVH